MVEHDRLISVLVGFLEDEGYSEIKADLDGYEKPQALWWTDNPDEKVVPDVTAKKNDAVYIYEVETKDSIARECPSEPWKLFSAWAGENDGEFRIFVEKGAETAVENRVSELEIKAKVI